MRPTFLGFETARRGLAVNQKGLDIVGNNLTNVHTPGYTRQRVDIYSISPSTARNRYGSPSASLAGQGVGMGGVSQMRDPFLDRRFRDEYSDVGYYDQSAAILEDIEAALDEFGSDTGLKNAIKDISKALNDFSSNPDSKVHANVVATTFKNITQTLHQFDSKLNNVAAQQIHDLEITTKSVNDILTKLAGLNKVIGDDIQGRVPDGEYYGPNELLDERNLLLDELARYGDISVKENADGTVKVDMGGKTVLDGEKTETLNFDKNRDGTVSLTWNSDGENFSSPGGTLQASVDLINGRGPYAQSENETNYKGVLFYKDKIDTFAKTLANTFNNIVPEFDEATGEPKLDGDGNVVYKQLLGSRNPDGSVTNDTEATAGSISLSKAWSDDSDYLIYNEGDKDPKYANALSAALTTNKQDFAFGGSSTNMTFEDFVNDYVGICGADLSFNSGRLDASASIADDLLDRRDQVSAVAPDEETANMMLYNKSYQAVARLMTTLDEALDILINSTGMVGR